MITIQTQSDGVLFNFQDSTRYLYGGGSILTPYNSLTLIADESNVLTFRKSASNDIFITAGYDELGYSSKEEAINDLKTKLFKATGGGGGSESGITSGEVQTMIDNSLEDYYTDDEVDAALSGKADARNVYTIAETNYLLNDLSQRKADTSAVTAVANDVSTLSGQVATKVNTTDFSAYSAATDARIAEDEEVTAAALNNLDENKQNALEFYSEAETEDSETGEIDKYGQIEVADELNGAHIYADYLSTNEEKSPYASIDAWVNDGEGNEKQNRVYAEADGVQLWADENADDGEGNIVYRTANVSVTSTEVGMSVSEDVGNTTTTLSITSTGVTINDENVVTENQLADYQPVLSAGTGIEISGNVISATGGGGATYSAGTNISIDTANTINCTLNLRNGSGSGSVIIGNNNTATQTNSFAQGQMVKATGQNSHAEGGGYTESNGTASHAEGWMAKTIGNFSHAEGYGCTANTEGSHAEGYYIITNNNYEHSQGKYNVSNTGSTASGQTLFSVGNGTSSARHNAFEIRQNGDIYVNDGTNDVRLQDTILALGGLKLVKLTQAEYDALVTKDANTLYIISNVVS